MKCKHCGAEIDDDSVYCEFCGKRQAGKLGGWIILVIIGVEIVVWGIVRVVALFD